VYNFNSSFDTISTYNKGSVLVKRSLYFIKTEPLFHQDRGSVQFSPRADEFQPTDKQPWVHVPSTFTHVMNLYPPLIEHIKPTRWVYIPTTLNI